MWWCGGARGGGVEDVPETVTQLLRRHVVGRHNVDSAVDLAVQNLRRVVELWQHGLTVAPEPMDVIRLEWLRKDRLVPEQAPLATRACPTTVNDTLIAHVADGTWITQAFTDAVDAWAKGGTYGDTVRVKTEMPRHEAADLWNMVRRMPGLGLRMPAAVAFDIGVPEPTECDICFDAPASVTATTSRRAESWAAVGCDHKFCRSCLTKYIESKYTLGVVHVSCPAGWCPAKIYPIDAHRIGGDALLAKLPDAIESFEVPDGVTRCVTCNVPYIRDGGCFVVTCVCGRRCDMSTGRLLDRVPTAMHPPSLIAALGACTDLYSDDAKRHNYFPTVYHHEDGAAWVAAMQAKIDAGAWCNREFAADLAQRARLVERNGWAPVSTGWASSLLRVRRHINVGSTDVAIWQTGGFTLQQWRETVAALGSARPRAVRISQAIFPA